LRIACVFSPPAEGNPDVKQIQEDLPQEQHDNQEEPEEKKARLKEIIADYNSNYGTNHDINKFDDYYQDVQKRIKDQQYSNQDYQWKHKIDITIVVDMLLTGFDSKYLNTLYVDKNLKYHGLIQAFSRTNRILNDTKPYGNILDFRQQEGAVDEAIKLFSGKKGDKPEKEIWLVDSAPVVIEKLEDAVDALNKFMTSQGLDCSPEEVSNLKGDAARGTFINLFKDVQRLKTQLDQYTDLTPENEKAIEEVLPAEQLWGFRGVYLETAQRLKAMQSPWADESSEVNELDFEFVLFASAMIDYDYIMGLLANYTQQKPEKQKMTREQLIGLIDGDAKFVDDREELEAYIRSLEIGKGLNKEDIIKGYEQFKQDKHSREIRDIAEKHGIEADNMKEFIDTTLRRMIFDGEALSDLFVSLDLGWKERSQKEAEFMKDVYPLLQRLAQGKEISGLKAYEE
jgi:type I restriction enzyme R subunit